MLVSNVGVKQYIAFLKTGQKIKKAPGFVKKPGENLAYLPLLDTMHHALNTWCIFYWFHFDSQGRWGQKGQNAECSSRSLLSAVPEAFCRQIISGMFLVNVQKQRTKTHACIFYTRVRLFLFCRAILGSCASSFQRQLPGIF